MKLSLLLVFLGGATAATIARPDVQQVISRSVAATEADWNQAPHYSFTERDVDTKHDSEPVIKTYQVQMIEGSPYNRVVALNDKPLSPEQQAVEEEKLRAEIRKRQQESNQQRARRIAKYVKERNQDRAMLMNMVDVFEFKVVGDETVDGHDCWVLDATPKPGYHAKDRESKVLLGMRGRMWVDKSQYQWVRVKAEVVKSVAFFGFVAKVGPGTSFLLEQQPVSDNLWLPKHFTMRVNASALGFINENSTADETYRDYKLRSVAK